MQKLIVFSGLDGAGKSTQIENLRGELSRRGEQSVTLWTRGGYTPLFNLFKDVIRSLSSRRVMPESGPSEKRSQAFSHPAVRFAWLTIAILDLMFVYGVQIRWWKGRGRVVLCDRYLWDTAIDFQLNFPDNDIQQWWLWKLLTRVTPHPDSWFMMLIPVEESQRRSKLKFEPFPDPPERLEQRLQRYLAIADEEGAKVINATRSADEVYDEVKQDVFNM